MPKSISKNEKLVLYELVRHPMSTDRDISEVTGLKLSTVTAIRRRLKEKKMYYMVKIPCLHALGGELLAINYSVYKATAPMELRLKVSKEFAETHREVFWAINEYVQSVGIHFSGNYTNVRRNINELEEYYTEHGFLGEEGINLLVFPFEMVKMPYFFDYGPLLKQSFGLDDSGGKEDVVCGCPAEQRKADEYKLSDIAKRVYYNLIKHPEMTDTELSELISVSQRTITKLRKEFEKEGMIKTAIIPDLIKLGFKMLVFDHARLNLSIHGERRDNILDTLIGIKPPIMFLVGSSDVVALTAYEDFDTYRRSINRFSEIYKHDNIFVKEPSRLMFSLAEMDLLKDHVYAPLVAEILDIEE